jgi:hypothetical protein
MRKNWDDVMIDIVQAQLFVARAKIWPYLHDPHNIQTASSAYLPRLTPNSQTNAAASKTSPHTPSSQTQ